MARLYADENFDFAVVAALRLLGHDVLTALEARQANRVIPDDEVLSFGSSQGRAILTHNRRDFIRLNRSGQQHAGIIACTRDDAVALATRIHTTLSDCPVVDNQLVRIYRPHRPQD